MKRLIAICAITLIAAGTASADIYTTKAAWDTAVSGSSPVLTEDFSAMPFADFTIQSDFIDANPGEGGISIINTYGDFTGQWYDQVDDEVGKETTISFNQTIYGFGGYWNLNGPTGPGEGIELWVGGNQVATITRFTQGTFVGIAGIGGFNTLVIRGWDEVSGVETFALDNASYAVPVPGAILLGILGLSVAGVKLRRFV